MKEDKEFLAAFNPDQIGMPFVIKGFRQYDDLPDGAKIAFIDGHEVFCAVPYKETPLNFDFNTEIYNKGQLNGISMLHAHIKGGSISKKAVKEYYDNYIKYLGLTHSNLEEVEEDDQRYPQDVFLKCTVSECRFNDKNICNHNNPTININHRMMKEGEGNGNNCYSFREKNE